MKRQTTILTACLLLISSVWMTAQAQWGGPSTDPHEMAAQQTHMMVDSLGLSTAQAEKIAVVNGTYAQKFQEVRDNADGDFKATREAMQQLTHEQDQALRKYLTSDQWASWQEIRSRMRQQKRQGRHHRD
ncbi:MAG: hypothetical protein K9I85_06390 [Saprospiraceae bacterium]|nr:hypothetical protein [Saprospiraceae bacterium]